MPLDVWGCTRVTLACSTSINHLPSPEGCRQSHKACRDGDRALQLSHVNEEFLVGVGHQPAPITSLPFVHTARRFYRLSCSMRTRDWGGYRWPKGLAGPSENLFESRSLEEEEVVTRFP